MNKRCIISLATKAGRYVDNLARLSNSLRENFKTGDFLGFIHESTVGAPMHEDSPYAFKVYAFNKAKELGYTSVLWLDTSCYAVGNIDDLFNKLEQSDNGLMFQDAGHFLGNWCNDKTLEYFDITRDAAMSMRMIGNAGFLGIDFTSVVAETFFNDWAIAEQLGYFKGAWNNNEQTESLDPRCLGARHDMSASSAIIHKMSLFKDAIPGDQILQYAGPFDKVINDTIVLKAQG